MMRRYLMNINGRNDEHEIRNPFLYSFFLVHDNDNDVFVCIVVMDELQKGINTKIDDSLLFEMTSIIHDDVT